MEILANIPRIISLCASLYFLLRTVIICSSRRMRVVKKLYGDDATNRIFFFSTHLEIQHTQALAFKKIDENSGPRLTDKNQFLEQFSAVQSYKVQTPHTAMGLRASKPKHVLNATTTTTTTTGTPQQTTPGGLRVRVSSSLYSSFPSSFSSLTTKNERIE